MRCAIFLLIASFNTFLTAHSREVYVGREYRYERPLRSILSYNPSYFGDLRVTKLIPESSLTRENQHIPSTLRGSARKDTRITRSLYNIIEYTQQRTNQFRTKRISYAREGQPEKGLFTDNLLNRDGNSRQSHLRNVEDIGDSTIDQRAVNTKQHYTTNSVRRERTWRLSERHASDGYALHNFDNNRKATLELRATLSRTRQTEKLMERMNERNSVDAKLRRILRNTKQTRSRSVDSLRQSERRNTRYSGSLEDRQTVKIERLRRFSTYREKETTQADYALQNRDRTRNALRTRNTRNLFRTDIAAKSSDILEASDSANSQDTISFISLRREVRGHIGRAQLRTFQRSYTQSRSLKQSNLPNNRQILSTIRENNELEYLNNLNRETRSVVARGTNRDIEVRDIRKEFVNKHYARDNKMQGHFKDTSNLDKDNINRSEQRSRMFSIEPIRAIHGHERKNMLRETSKHSRFEASRDISNHPVNEKYLLKYLLNWTTMFYILQAIYLCNIVIQVLTQSELTDKKSK
ncbi:unnamed protein product [Colias eurytheme]|nr:unnamed protein product [Colias eurytheme]